MRIQRLSPFCGLALTLIFFISGSLSAQNILSDMDHDARWEYDRMIILSGGGSPQLHSSIFPYLRSDLVILADSFYWHSSSAKDAHQIQTIWDQNNEFVRPSDSATTSEIQYVDSSLTFYYLNPDSSPTRYRLSKHPLWKTFYRTPAHFYEVDVKDFYLRLDPMLRLGVGRESNEDVTTFMNQRGISLRGGVGKNVYFHTSVYDTQARYSNYINDFTDSTGVIPGAALYKTFESAIFNSTDAKDYLLATAYVGINFGKYIGMQLGHNQHFIGDGIRSLFFSDFSTPLFSLKFNTRIWKFHYQNIFGELAADGFQATLGTNQPVPKKYMAAHYLSFKLNKTITLGLFESVIFDRPDNQFELQYLNPIILYRTIEGAIGSPDNVMLGFSARVNIKKTVSVYSQLIIDDIYIGDILDGNLDWWGNKFGYQLGAKYINVLGINSLDVQLEWNSVRPYTYSHYNQTANYSHYKQALAHPLGANFNEWIASMHYRFSPRLNFQSSIYLMSKGEDIDSISYGGDINVPNTQRPSDYGHFIGQGVGTDMIFWSSGLHYELSSGLFLDLQYLYRKKTSDISERDLNTNQFQFGVRLNMARREDVF